jgi:hypothetical protein
MGLVALYGGDEREIDKVLELYKRSLTHVLVVATRELSKVIIVNDSLGAGWV